MMTLPVGTAQADVRIENHGTLFLFFPQTRAGWSWISGNVQPDAIWSGDGLVVEHGYARPLAADMMAAGLSLE